LEEPALKGYREGQGLLVRMVSAFKVLKVLKVTQE
jgi:hypothetical protein